MILRYLRRQWVSRKPFPQTWERLLMDKMPVYRLLPDELKGKLQRRIFIFMDEKLFEGCGGLELTEEMRLLIAAQACLLILEENSDYYPALQAILVYPKDYMAPVYEVSAGGVVTEGWESRSGESWNPGNIVLSWSDVLRGLRNPSDARNLVYHECAHQLDHQYGLTAGIDPEGDAESEDEWTEILSGIYRELVRKVRRGQAGLLDSYGATNPAECFAVITECFIERPVPLHRTYPELYSHLTDFFGYDPARWYNGE